MVFLARSLLITLLGLLFAVGFLLSQILESSPKNSLVWQAKPDLAREIFIKIAEQTRTKVNLSFDQTDINHLFNSLLNRYFKSSTVITLYATHASIDSSLKLPKLFNYYCNVHFELHNQGNGMAVSNLHMGNITLSASQTGQLTDYVLNHSFLRHYYRLGIQHIQTIHITNHRLVASYILNSTATGLASANTINPKVLAFYQQKIEDITRLHDTNWRLSLADLLHPLFKLAYQRTTLENAISENIAIIHAVSAYVNNNETPFYLATTKPVTHHYLYPVYLYKRTDQAKHFMLSAVLTISGGVKLADIIGQEKELRDAQLQSGFSFIDLAADRAGMKLSEQATRSPQSAKELQRKMADIKNYTAFMPDVQDLPEKLTQSQFNQRFKAFDSDTYRKLLRDIDERINALPLYATQ